MKTKLFALLVTLIIPVFGIIGLGCEPYGGGPGYQYLGRLDGTLLICDSSGNHTTTLTIDQNTITVVGKVELRLRPGLYYVWVNVSKKVVRLRQLRTLFEYSIVRIEATPNLLLQ